MKSLLKTLFTGLLAMTFAVMFNIDSATAQDENVVDVIKSNDENTLFAELLEETDMPEVLEQEGPYTVLVPTDEAIESLDADVDELKENPEELQGLLRNHLYQGEMSAEEVEAALNLEVVEGDAEASNGVIHQIDEVIEGQGGGGGQ